jgi:lysozyme family protein
MSTLEASMPFLLKHEGKWSNRRQDRGGPTMYGITLAVARWSNSWPTTM